MKIVTISDTHGYHDLLALPKGDVLIHAGDVSSRGSENEVKNFLNWFTVQDYRYKIFIAGNHDFFFEQADEEMVKVIIPENIIYLNDSGICIEGVHIWGSPVTPWFLNWAFNRNRGADIKKHWDLIPANTDILITHGPAYGVLDQTVQCLNAGCEILKDAIEIIMPGVHICGHIHEGYGMKTLKETLHINASVLDVRYRMVNEPVVFDL